MDVKKIINLIIGKKNEIDFNTIEGIEKIELKRTEKLTGLESPTNEIEYILQRKATEHKKNGRMDLAIACLKKSNELMDKTTRFKYQEKDYLRYIKYLRLDKQNELADKEELILYQKHPEFKDKRISNLKRIKEYIEKCKSFNQDLLYITTKSSCNICSKYDKKIFSISGKSKKYAKLPTEFSKQGGFCPNCIVGVSIYSEDLN